MFTWPGQVFNNCPASISPLPSLPKRVGSAVSAGKRTPSQARTDSHTSPARRRPFSQRESNTLLCSFCCAFGRCDLASLSGWEAARQEKRGPSTPPGLLISKLPLGGCVLRSHPHTQVHTRSAPSLTPLGSFLPWQEPPSPLAIAEAILPFPKGRERPACPSPAPGPRSVCRHPGRFWILISPASGGSGAAWPAAPSTRVPYGTAPHPPKPGCAHPPTSFLPPPRPAVFFTWHFCLKCHRLYPWCRPHWERG